MFKTETFYQIINFLRDNSVIGDLPPELRQTALNAQTRTEQLFTRVIDQIPFSSPDYNRLRVYFIDWYSSLKTLQEVAKESTDAFSLSDDLLAKALEGFGFPYGTYITGRYDKVLFLYSICELYKIKGTASSIKKALEFMGLYDLRIFEWWLKYHKYTDNIYLESAIADSADSGYPMVTFTIPIQTVNYNTSIFNSDPHWLYTEDQIRALLATNNITLPSITPYFSISGFTLLSSLWQVYVVISRIIRDQWEKFNTIGLHEVASEDYDVKLELWYENYVTLLEVVLSIAHVYHSWTGRTATSIPSSSFLCYADDVNPGPTQIIDEYNNIVRRPVSYDEREDLVHQFYEKFTVNESTNFINTVDDAGDRLELVNPDLKAFLDDILTQGDDVIFDSLKSLLRELDGYARQKLKIQGVSFENILLGFDYEKVREMVEFFKPKRARIIGLNVAYVVSNPLLDTQIEKDTVDLSIHQWNYEDVDVDDDLEKTIITQWEVNNDYITCPPGWSGSYQDPGWVPPSSWIGPEPYIPIGWASMPQLVNAPLPGTKVLPPGTFIPEHILGMYDVGDNYDVVINPTESWPFNFDNNAFFDAPPMYLTGIPIFPPGRTFTFDPNTGGYFDPIYDPGGLYLMYPVVDFTLPEFRCTLADQLEIFFPSPDEIFIHPLYFSDNLDYINVNNIFKETAYLNEKTELSIELPSIDNLPELTDQLETFFPSPDEIFIHPLYFSDKIDYEKITHYTGNYMPLHFDMDAQFDLIKRDPGDIFKVEDESLTSINLMFGRLGRTMYFDMGSNFDNEYRAAPDIVPLDDGIQIIINDI